MPLIHGSLNYERCTVTELRKFYRERTRSARRRRGHAPSRWKKHELISALKALDRDKTFDFFSRRGRLGGKQLPPEIRNMIYDNLKDIIITTSGPDRRYADLRSLSLTCKQAHAEVSGIIHSLTTFNIPICWSLNDETTVSPWEVRNYHTIIENGRYKSIRRENNYSPIVLHRLGFSGLQHVERCKIFIHVLGVSPAFGWWYRWSSPNANADDLLKHDVPIMSRIIAEIRDLNPRMKSLNIQWKCAAPMPWRTTAFLQRLVLSALPKHPGRTGDATGIPADFKMTVGKRTWNGFHAPETSVVDLSEESGEGNGN